MGDQDEIRLDTGDRRIVEAHSPVAKAPKVAEGIDRNTSVLGGQPERRLAEPLDSEGGGHGLAGPGAAVTDLSARRLWRAGIATANPNAAASPNADMTKAVVKPDSSGRPVRGATCPATTLAAIWPPSAPPIVRTIVFMAVATPVWRWSTASTIRLAIDANANPTPRPSIA